MLSNICFIPLDVGLVNVIYDNCVVASNESKQSTFLLDQFNGF
jgi:hypothetical protein